MTQTGEGYKDINSFFLPLTNSDLPTVNICSFPAICRPLESIFQVTQLDSGTISAPLFSLSRATTILLPIVVGMRKPSESYSLAKNNFWLTCTLAGVTLTHDSLSKKLRMNEGLMPIPSPIEDVIGSQMDVLVVDNNHGRQRHLRRNGPPMKKNPHQPR